MSDKLYHYGVLGMRWGHRKNSDNSSGSVRKNSEDHEKVAAIHKKSLRNMTAADLKTAVDRMRLVKKYKDSIPKGISKLRLGEKPISEMSNKDLIAAIRREKLKKEDWEHGVRKDKPIKRMTDAEVKETLDRYLLEKPYRELRAEELAPALKLVKILLRVVGSTVRVVSGNYYRNQPRGDSDDVVEGDYYILDNYLPEKTEE